MSLKKLQLSLKSESLNKINIEKLNLKELNESIKLAYKQLDLAEEDEEFERLEDLLDKLENQEEKKLQEREAWIEGADAKMQEMMKKIEVLENALLYAPGGEGYEKAKEDFFSNKSL